MLEYDSTVIVTAYEASETIDSCLMSIFRQEVGNYKVLILVGYDRSVDDTLRKLVSLGDVCPEWAEFRILANSSPAVFIDGARTGRSNFLNCYGQVKGRALLFCDGDDSWTDPRKLIKQLELVLHEGKGSYAKSQALEVPDDYNPFTHGNKIIFSSLCIPISLCLDLLITRIRLLDWYIVCKCYHERGLVPIEGDVKYSEEDGSWSGLSRIDRLKSSISSARIMLEGCEFDSFSMRALRIYIFKLHVLYGVEFCKKIFC